MLVPPYEIKKLSLDGVKTYEFNDMFFQTNVNGILEHEEVIELDGFSQIQIYRALKDWFFVNSKKLIAGAYFEDNKNLILYGSVSTKVYWNLNIQSDINVTDEDPVIRVYNLSYDLIVRAKDNRFKIIMNNFAVYNNLSDNISRTLKNLYEKRYLTDNTKTLAYTESLNMPGFVKGQISSVKDQCLYIKDKDTFKESVIKYMLTNDDW